MGIPELCLVAMVHLKWGNQYSEHLMISQKKMLTDSLMDGNFAAYL